MAATHLIHRNRFNAFTRLLHALLIVSLVTRLAAAKSAASAHPIKIFPPTKEPRDGESCLDPTHIYMRLAKVR